MEPLDEIFSLLVQYATAMWLLQDLEVGLAHLAESEMDDPDIEKPVGEIVREVDHLFALTMGQLAQRLAVSPELAERLRLAIDLRNELAHGFLRKHYAEILIYGENRLALIKELAAQIEFLQATDSEVKAILGSREKEQQTPDGLYTREAFPRLWRKLNPLFDTQDERGDKVFDWLVEWTKRQRTS